MLDELPVFSQRCSQYPNNVSHHIAILCNRGLQSCAKSKNNEKNDKCYRKIAFFMYTEIVNFRPRSWKEASKLKPRRKFGTRLPSS